MREGNSFSLFTVAGGGEHPIPGPNRGGVPHPRSGWGGIPHSADGGGGYPIQDQEGGYARVPPPLFSRMDGVQDWMG